VPWTRWRSPRAGSSPPLQTTAPPKDREVEMRKAKERSRKRFARPSSETA
jgi:hypothetical protein